MDKLRAMQTTVAIADAGSLTGAARQLGSSLPAVVRSLAALEAELGTRLFHRTTRRIALTDAGRRYLERCREVQALVSEAEAELRAEQTEPQGTLRVTAPVFFGARHVVGGVSAFIQRYPAVSVELQLHDRVVNLLEEGIDVAVRIGELEDSSLIARPVSRMRRLTVAAPSYLARRGVPEHPRDLLGHSCVRFWHASSGAWVFNVAGKPLSVAVRGNLTVNHSAAAADACVAGLGVGMFLAYQVAPELARGELRVLLTSFETKPLPIHVVYPEARLLPARTRLFVDLIKQHIGNEEPAWQTKEPRRRAAAAPKRRR